MNNNEPLVLGKIKKGKTGRPLVVLIIFLFAGAIILFLPTIANYFGDYNIITLIKEGKIIDFFINHDYYVEGNQATITTTTTKKNDINEPKLINSKTIIEYNNFNLSNFNLTTNNITFTITTSNTINFDESNYYLVLEKDDKEFTTIKLTGVVNKELTSIFNFQTSITDTVEVKGYVKTFNDIDFPQFTLSSDETGLASLICEKDNDTYEYIFNNNLLAKIKETYIYVDDGNTDNYYKVFQEYTTLSNKIITNGGISSIEETFTGFTFKTEIDLNTYQDKINYNYYSLNTKSNKINFEMKAKGYDCK